MRNRCCVPLLLLLLLTPHAGDAAVITGVSTPAHLSARGAQGGWSRGGEGHGDGRPSRSTCPGRPVAHLGKCPAQAAADGAGRWALPGRRSDQSTTLPPLSPLFSACFSFIPTTSLLYLVCFSVQMKDIFQSLLKHFFKTFQPVILKFEGPFVKCEGAG